MSASAASCRLVSCRLVSGAWLVEPSPAARPAAPPSPPPAPLSGDMGGVAVVASRAGGLTA